MTTGPDPLVGSELGPYRLHARIGSGATGVVYRATRPAHPAPVALKVLHTDLGSISGLEGRYRREATILAKLSHPNVVRLLDFGNASGRTYIAMELLVGETLEDRLVQAPLDPAQVRPIYDAVLEALAEAHTLDVVHRDLKPANVFLHEDGRIMLLDFGLSKILSVEASEGLDADDTALTRAGRIVGTPGYMAPEQITGAFVDVRADVYALGIMLFELLADRRPFNYERRSELLRAHLLEPVPELASVRDGLWIAPELDALIKRALDKDAAARFQDAHEMLVALRALPGDHVRLAAEPRRESGRERKMSSSAFITLEERTAVARSASMSGEAAPVQQAPVQQAPVQQAPVQQAPVQQAPVQQAPVQQTHPPSRRVISAVLLFLIAALIGAAATGLWLWSRT